MRHVFKGILAGLSGFVGLVCALIILILFLNACGPALQDAASGALNSQTGDEAQLEPQTQSLI